MFDYLIVGAGFAGCTCARLLAERGMKIIVTDKKNHIGGNCYDFYDEGGILIHKYGPHIFHTQNKEVWDFLSKFTDWYHYQHKVLAYVEGKKVPIPINLDTINELYATHYTVNTIKDFFNSVKDKELSINNSKDMIVSQVGEELYEKFFKNYTKKQWGMYPEELDKEVTSRIPIRDNRDDRYFTDRYQGIPKKGYTELFNQMLMHSNIKVMLNTSYNEIKKEINYHKLIYTGPIDEFFEYKYGKLPYRSLQFIQEHYNIAYYQEVGTVNYPNDYEYTRITEYKYLTGQKSDSTSITKEIPRAQGEPYYPIPKKENKELYNQYAKETLTLKDIYFIGRLANYKYANMDVVVADAMALISCLVD
jgi:UDP-galactopyranose mutase